MKTTDASDSQDTASAAVKTLLAGYICGALQSLTILTLPHDHRQMDGWLSDFLFSKFFFMESQNGSDKI